jgi:hypothetical protein
VVFEEDFKLFSQSRELILSRKENLVLSFAVIVQSPLTPLAFTQLQSNLLIIIFLAVTVIKQDADSIVKLIRFIS